MPRLIFIAAMAMLDQVKIRGVSASAKAGISKCSKYRIALCRYGLAQTSRGDRVTPDGTYFISPKNPWRKYFLSLGISYSGVDDAARGLREGIITKAQHDAIIDAIRQHTAPPGDTALGGDIFAHARGSSANGTWRCIALDDAGTQEVYDSISAGTPITIHP